LLFQNRKIELSLNLLFLQKNIFFESDLAHKIMAIHNSLDLTNRPVIYYFDNTVLHLTSGKKIDIIHRPAWSPILFTQVFYLGDFIVLVDKNKSTVKTLNDLDEFIESQNPLIIKVENYNYFNPVNHPVDFKKIIEISENSRSFFDSSKVDELTGISVIIPTTFLNHSLSKEHSLSILTKQLYQIFYENELINSYEILLVYGPEHSRNFKKEFMLNTEIDGINIKFIEDESAFNFSKRVNLALKNTKFETILILNDDVIINNSINLSSINELLSKDLVASVSVLLKDSHDCFTHAGISINQDLTDEYLKGTPVNVLDPGTIFVREVDGNSFACVFIRKKVFEIVGFLDEKFPLDFNDVEWSLRAGSHKLRHVIVPHILGIHDISTTRGVSTSGEPLFEIVKYKYKITNEISLHEWIIPFCCLSEARLFSKNFLLPQQLK
jgi:hypothetical protein